ncbi:hypothetical protein ACWC9R_09915 [Streptomyces sp. NPDC001219]
MPFRVPLWLPFRRPVPSGAPSLRRARFRRGARRLRDARLRRRRPAVLLLLVAGLLSVVLPCADGADGHHRALGAAQVASGPSASVAVAPARVAAEEDAGHHGSACVPGRSGHLPEGRPAGGAEGAAAPAVLTGAARVAAARRPAAGGRAGQRRPVRGGRSTLAALCRCRI